MNISQMGAKIQVKNVVIPNFKRLCTDNVIPFNFEGNTSCPQFLTPKLITRFFSKIKAWEQCKKSVLPLDQNELLLLTVCTHNTLKYVEIGFCIFFRARFLNIV